MDPPKTLCGTQCNFSSKRAKLLCANPFFPTNTRSTMVSSMEGNVGDDKGWGDKVIYTAMKGGSSDIGDGKDV